MYAPTPHAQNWKGGQAQGFALFSSGAHAMAACNVVSSIQFDEAAVLRCEMARKNMYVKEGEGAKRQRSDGPLAPPGQDPAAAMAPQGFAPVSNLGDNPPCSTLFVGNLGDNVKLTREKAKITVSSELAMSKR